MTKEFVSKLEEVMPAEELLFDPTPAFGKYGAIMPEESIAHPAKFNTNLVEFLIKTYTELGDIILDPMAGSGVLGVIAALHGRNAIQVEIEEKFFRWMEKARENVEKIFTLTPKGKIVNILGDARRLSELLNQVDTIITSPPYLDVDNVKRNSEDFWLKAKELGKRWGSKPPAGTEEKQLSKNNIGSLPLGDIDAIITSPPFGDTNLGGGDPEKRRERLLKAGYDPRDFLGGKARNAVLKHYNEVDAIVTSPPYAIDPKNVCHTREGKTLEDYDVKRGFKPTTHPRTGYSPNPDNIGNLPLGNIDAIITSPPYDGSLEGTSRHTRGGIASRDPALAQTGTYATVLTEVTKQGVPICYSPNPENIGNLKSSDEEYEALAKGLMTKSGKPTYLSEMLKVYRECYKVLKPNGLAVIVVKPFIRNKKPVDLPYHTYVLLSLCGFTLEKLYKLRLKQQSFWRRLLYRKYPDVERINHEYVLVMRKPHEQKLR